LLIRKKELEELKTIIPEYVAALSQEKPQQAMSNLLSQRTNIPIVKVA
jgi:hypothetical protein